MSNLGNRLRELRGDSSLYEVAKELGIQRSHLKRYEDGEYLPTETVMEYLARYYEEHYEELWFLYFDCLFSNPTTREMAIKWAMNRR
jgi:transcriptional regulator with XRE-family HTH domain